MTIAEMCDHAIARIDRAIARHEGGEPEDLNVELLREVRREIVSMRDARDAGVFSPGYARFLLDWPDEHGLVQMLVDLSHKYKQVCR